MLSNATSLALVGLFGLAQPCAAAAVCRARTAQETSPPADPQAPSRADFEERRGRLQSGLLQEFVKLASDCTPAKALALRARAWTEILELAPDHSAARRGLGFKRDREGVWQPPKRPRNPKNLDQKKAAPLQERLDKLAREYGGQVLALEADFRALLSSKDRRELFMTALRLQPDDEALRTALGEVRLDRGWVMAESAVADASRERLAQRIEEARAAAPVPQEVDASPREASLGPTWTGTLATPALRLSVTGDVEEGRRTAEALFVVRELLAGHFGVEPSYHKDYTVFSMATHEDKLAFIGSYPDLTDAYREYLGRIESSGIEGTGDFATWSLTEDKRRDTTVRHAVGWLLSSAWGIQVTHGWIYEGFGVYLTHRVTGTRLTWFVRPSEYLRKTDDSAFQYKLRATDSDWYAAAITMLEAPRRPQLRFVVGKDVNSLTTEELLYSHAIAAYLIEAHGDKVARLLTLVAAPATPPIEAIEEVLGMDPVEFDTHLLRFLKERPKELAPAPATDQPLEPGRPKRPGDK